MHIHIHVHVLYEYACTLYLVGPDKPAIHEKLSAGKEHAYIYVTCLAHHPVHIHKVNHSD